MRTAFHSGNLAEADGLIGRHLDDHPRESDVLRLDRAMPTLANLVQDGDDAEASSLRVSAKQRQIVATATDEKGRHPKAAPHSRANRRGASAHLAFGLAEGHL